MDKFKTWLKKHTGLYCIFKLIKQFKNYDFRDYLLSYKIGMRWREFILPDSSAINLSICNRGELNQDKTIYEIPMDTAAFGMGSQMVVMLNRINFADTLGMFPCVNWYASKLYKEEHPFRGTTNIFEYYFRPIGGITVEEAENSRYVVYDDLNKNYGFDLAFIPMVANNYTYTEDDIDKYAAIMRKYVKLNTKVQKQMSHDIGRVLKGKKILGVHGRGGDMKLAFLNHPIFVTAQEYVAEAKKAKQEIGADYIFLATDDQEILDAFIEEFGDVLLYYSDVVRSTGRIHNGLVKVEREHHHFKLGYEILRDIYTLSRCDGFLSGMSYINCMTRIIKKAGGNDFELKKIIDKGRHTDGVNVNDPSFQKNDDIMLEKIRQVQESGKNDEQVENELESVLAGVYGRK